MPESPEAQKEIIEIKREVREIRLTQDAEIYQSRKKWEDYVFRLLRDNADMMRVLLAIDGSKSAKDLEKECNLYQVKCWRILDILQREGVIYKMEQTKKGSPVYSKSRWYKVLRLDEKVVEKLETRVPQTTANLPGSSSGRDDDANSRGSQQDSA